MPQEPLQSNQDTDEQLRNKAIDLFIAGTQPKDICQQLDRSRAWFYQVLNRYKHGGREALASRSRAPHTTPNRTPESQEAAIVRLRQLIVAGQDPDFRYANLGADALAAELERAGLTPPSRATINRILHRHELVRPRPRRKAHYHLPGDYPWPWVQGPNQMHLFDFVSRVITGGSLCYGYNLLDEARRWPYLRAMLTKTAADVAQFLVSAWQEIGLPQALYLDNDVTWRGSSSGQRTVSRVVRLCLLLGVQVIFIPPYTPEANPVIESFNGVWDRNFWQRTTFRDLAHVRSELTYFQHYCRHRRPLTELGHRFADQLYPDFSPVLLAADFGEHRQNRLPITAGQVHFIRFVAEDGTCSLLNERWQLKVKQWAGKTVRATVDTGQQSLSIYHQESRKVASVKVAQFDYELSEAVVPLAERFRRPSQPLWPDSTDSVVKVSTMF